MVRAPTPQQAALARALLAVLAAVGAAPLAPNMNGDYTIANPRASAAAAGTPHADGFSTDWTRYPSTPENAVRSFDIYSPPIRTQYSQVFWTMMGNVPLPEDVVREFDGKAIAIVGYESDQVQMGKNGEPDSRVPITWAYNHHYGPIIAGKGTELKNVKLTGPDDPRNPHTGHPMADGTAWIVEPSCANLAGEWHDSTGEGGTLTITQSGCNLTATAGKQIAWSPATGTVDHDGITMKFGAQELTGIYEYDGIDWQTNGAHWERGASPPPGQVLPVQQTFYIGNGGEYRKSYHGMPPGTAQVIASPSVFHIQPMQIDTKNRDGSMDRPEQGFTPGPYPRAAVAPRTGPDATYSGLLECPCTDRITKKFDPTFATQHSGNCSVPAASAEECFAAAASLGLIGFNHSGASTALPTGCTATTSMSNGKTSVFFNTAATSAVPCGGGKPVKMTGSASSMIQVSLDLDAATSTATIHLTGPAAVWFGVGFDATKMGDLPYAVVVDGAGKVSEHKLADHSGGTVLSASVKVVSSTVVNGKRTVVLTRPLRGATTQHYTFDPSQTQMHFINALGAGVDYAYHASKTAAVMSLFAEDAPNCLCNQPAPFGQTKGSIEYFGPTNYTTNPDRATQSLGFSKACRARGLPLGADLLHLKNPTCDLATYQGGLSCCHHLWLLTDKDQESIISPEVFEYHIKFRYYYQEYIPANGTAPASHQNLVRLYHQTEDAASEYDIPLCNRNTTAAEDCVYTITAHWQVKDMLSPKNVPPISNVAAAAAVMGGDDELGSPQTDDTGVKIMFAGGHCHAPACISIELYNADTGELICRQTPVIGKTLRPTNTTGNGAYDEAGYISIPPCMWGADKYGLEPALLLTWDTNLTSIKKNNNSYAHFGEMASWQMRGYATH